MKLLLLLLLRFVVAQSAALDDSGGSTVAKKWDKDALSGSKDPVFSGNSVGTGFNSKQGGNGEILGENGGERSVCELPAVRGPCRATLPRYNYDSVSQTCQEFKYGGNNIFAILNSQKNIRFTVQHYFPPYANAI